MIHPWQHADNSIGENGVLALVHALQLQNITLKAVDLGGNPCEKSAAAALKELEQLLQRNRVIKKAPATPASVIKPMTPRSVAMHTGEACCDVMMWHLDNDACSATALLHHAHLAESCMA